MSEKFEQVNYYYFKGYWKKSWVWEVVGTWITPEEYKLITGGDFLKEKD